MKKAAIVACSNAQKLEYRAQVEELAGFLRTVGMEVKLSECIYERGGEASSRDGGSLGDVFSGTAEERAEQLMKMFKDPEVEEIFDISGGDVANQILDRLDYEAIAASKAVFWGYSDLSTVINAIYTLTGKESVLYQVKNMVRGAHAELQRERFCGWLSRAERQECREPDERQECREPDERQGCREYVVSHVWAEERQNCRESDEEGQECRVPDEERNKLFAPSFRFAQGRRMKGVVVGGNIRCFLKLAGTRYFPDLRGKVLLLEAMGGEVPQMATYLAQLKQLGAFEKIGGVLLGTFSAMERGGCVPDIVTLVKEVCGPEMPIAVTGEIGHGDDSKAIVIGREIELKV